MLAKSLRNSLWCAAPVLIGLAGTASASVTISTAVTSNMNCAAGVCTPSAATANLNTSDLQAMLATGNVKVTTGTSANDIDVADAVTWASTSGLTLQAARSIAVDAVVAVEAKAALILATHLGGSGGALSFGASGKVDFWDRQSKLKIDGQRYKLADNIDALIEKIAADPSGAYAMSTDFVLHKPYGAAPIQFLGGTFDGLGHTLSKLRIHTLHLDDVGLVAFSRGRIAHLVMADATIAHGNNAGFVAGTNSGTIDGVTASGSLYAGGSLGGIAGVNAGVIEGSRATVQMKKNANQSRVGGVAGTSTGTIDHSRGVLLGQTTEDIVGGLVGYADTSAVIVNSSATVGTIANSTAGGLVGVNLGSISTSYSDGTAESFNDENSVSGGLVGNNQGLISECYSSATVEAMGTDVHGAAGGLVGINSGTVASSYATGTAVTGELNEPGGGLIGADNAIHGITFSYWDIDTSNVKNLSQGAGNVQNDPGISGLSDAALKSGLPSGFSGSVWGQSAGIGNGYPYLLGNPPQ